MTTVQFITHLIIIIGALLYENEQPYSYWIVWQLVVFILAWGSTMSIRMSFILLVYLKVLNRNSDHMKIKEAYWLTLTTKEEIVENKGRPCHDPFEAA